MHIRFIDLRRPSQRQNIQEGANHVQILTGYIGYFENRAYSKYSLTLKSIINANITAHQRNSEPTNTDPQHYLQQLEFFESRESVTIYSTVLGSLPKLAVDIYRF